MILTDNTKGYSKVVARLFDAVGDLKKDIVVTVSENSPESLRLTHSLPRTKGWRLVRDAPLRTNGRKDYIKFIKQTNAREVWIKISTTGGTSKIYIR